MQKPDDLKPGDQVAIIAPARKLSQSEYEQAAEILRSFGLVPVAGKFLFESQHQLAGTDQQRASDFLYALHQHSIKALFCFRGGYGTLKMIDHCLAQPWPQKPKWLVGFSDITVLHAAAQQKGWMSLHAAMPVNWIANKGQPAAKSTLEFLFNNQRPFLLNPHPLNRYQPATAQVVGGNLSVLYSLLGSHLFPDTENKFLFIEDLDEYLYHLDRLMTALKRAGKLSKLAGLLIGGFTEMKDNLIPWGKQAEEIIAEACQDYDYPIIFGLPCGHIENNQPLLLGATYQLSQAESFIKLEIIN